MFGHALIATDFSTASMNAVERSATLPLLPSAALTLLHVAPEPPTETPELSSRLEWDAERQLAITAERLASLLARAGRADVRLARKVLRGRPPVEIARAAADEAADLLLLGHVGHGGWKELVLGPTAVRVVRRCTAPTLVVRRRPLRPYRRVLVGYDGSDASRRALGISRQLLADERQPLAVVHVHEPGFDELPDERQTGERERMAREQALRASLEQATPSVAVELSFRTGDVRRELERAIDERAPDLVAVGTRSLHAFAALLLGSVAESVVRNAACDVLVVPDERSTRLALDEALHASP